MDAVGNSVQVMGFTEIIANMDLIPRKFLPLVAVVLGVLITVAQEGFSTENVIKGALVGGGTTGAVKFIKNTKKQ